MSSRRQKLLARVNWYLQSSLKHIPELITGNKSYYRGGRYRQVSLYIEMRNCVYIVTSTRRIHSLCIHYVITIWYTQTQEWPYSVQPLFRNIYLKAKLFSHIILNDWSNQMLTSIHITVQHSHKPYWCFFTAPGKSELLRHQLRSALLSHT